MICLSSTMLLMLIALLVGLLLVGFLAAIWYNRECQRDKEAMQKERRWE